MERRDRLQRERWPGLVDFRRESGPGLAHEKLTPDLRIRSPRENLVKTSGLRKKLTPAPATVAPVQQAAGDRALIAITRAGKRWGR